MPNRNEWFKLEGLSNSDFKNLEEIIVDVDGVVYDLPQRCIDLIEKEYGDKLTTMRINSWSFYNKYPKVYELFGDWEQYSKGEFYKGAREFMYRLRDIAGQKKVKLVTASYDSIIQPKDEMLTEILGVEPESIIHDADKSLYSKNAVMIDDGLHNISDHVITHRMPGVIMDRGYGWNQDRLEDKTDLIQRAGGFDQAALKTELFFSKKHNIRSILEEEKSTYPHAKIAL